VTQKLGEIATLLTEIRAELQQQNGTKKAAA
jgi:hypothetical protein